ncbi:hypothetical protein cce_5056 [Crocosphaera subtropica ATCC 51142]|uniref:Uncharacterized protein n=1 Tax=Crocosphaera subtropica (strain ATCC 51142 / BH68) TaxID=43989 RepID=B1X2P1_CROS5|nr:APHP domain protein [Crocosphaera subtropica]ACB54402.1 hypothetical protein cce_5056 [Crocosphaera subtropica ATCC 51142]
MVANYPDLKITDASSLSQLQAGTAKTIIVEVTNFGTETRLPYFLVEGEKIGNDPLNDWIEISPLPNWQDISLDTGESEFVQLEIQHHNVIYETNDVASFKLTVDPRDTILEGHEKLSQFDPLSYDPLQKIQRTISIKNNPVDTDYEIKNLIASHYNYLKTEFDIEVDKAVDPLTGELNSTITNQVLDLHNQNQLGGIVDNFDEHLYIASYGDLIQAFGYDGEAALDHYLMMGATEGRDQHRFNAAQYLENYGDIRDTYGLNADLATKHFIANGFAEGRTYQDIS